MRKLLKKLNNQGSTLLTVIICIALIGILGSMMLSATMTNLQMKIVEKKSRENFYSCEMAMEEIRVGIQELTANAIKTVYQDNVLLNYEMFLSWNETERNANVQNLVVNELKLGSDSLTIDRIRGFITNPAEVTITSINFIDAIGVQDASVLIEDLAIVYEKNEYMTSITTNLIISIPKFSFEQGTEIHSSSMVQPFQNYVLVADGDIISNNTVGINNTSIQGSIYAGTNINIINELRNGSHNVIIDGANIVTRGNITVYDTAKLTLGNHTTPIIWADNLVTQTSPSYNNSGSTLPTSIDIKGTCIIKDDLVLEGRNSNVMFGSGGAYIGYTGTHTAKGSAIMINGSGSSLNLSGLSSLILAGRAHVEVGETELNSDYILTGESVAFKSNQRAYLLPGNFIKNILHNPVTEADIMPGGAVTPIVPEIQMIADGGIDYPYYVAGSLRPYKIAAKQTLASTLRYYYMNFGNGKLADEFLKIYFDTYQYVLNRMEPFTLGDVTLPSSGFYSVGNLMHYPAVPVGSDKTVELTMGLSHSYTDDVLLNNYIKQLILDPIIVGPILGNKEVSQLEGLYSRMSHLLSLEGTTRVYNELDNVVETSINAGGVSIVAGDASQILSSEGIYEFVRINTNYDPTKEYFAIINGDATIQSGAVLNGILIASGNITIGDNAIINGLVITTGENGDGNIHLGNGVQVYGRLVAAKDINLGTNCTLEVNEANIEPVFALEGTILSKLIKADTTVNFSTTLPAELLVDLSIANMISYENWRKN